MKPNIYTIFYSKLKKNCLAIYRTFINVENGFYLFL